MGDQARQTLQEQFIQLKILQEEESAKLGAIQQEISSLQEVCMNEESQVIQLNRNKRSMMSKNYTLQVDLDDAEMELIKLGCEYERLKNSLTEIHQLKVSLEKSATDLESIVQNEKKAHDEYVARVQNHFSEGSAEGRIVNDLKLELAQLNTVLEERRKMVEQESSNCNNLDQEVVSKQQQLQKMVSERNTMSEERSKLEHSMHLLKLSIEEKSQMIDQRVAESSYVDGEIDKQEQILKQIESQTEEQENRKRRVAQLEERVNQEYKVKELRLERLRRRE